MKIVFLKVLKIWAPPTFALASSTTLPNGMDTVEVSTSFRASSATYFHTSLKGSPFSSTLRTTKTIANFVLTAARALEPKTKPC